MKKLLIAILVAVGIFGLIKIVRYKPSATTATTISTTEPTPSTSTSVSTNTVAPTPAPAAASSGLKNGTYSGSTAQTGYGPVQVQITVSGGKITAAKMLQVPSDHSRSYQISQYATPTLIQETLAAQSASIDSVSGATFTSEGYIQSLQSALSQAS